MCCGLCAAVVGVSGLGTEAVKQFGVTYNCKREGGNRITITGHNFGLAGARVTVAGRPCTNVVHDIPEMQVSCTIPAGTTRVGT